MKDDFDVLVRVTKQRHWLRGSFKENVQVFVKQLPTKHHEKLRKDSDRDIRFGLTRVRLPEHPDRSLSLTVACRGKRESMVLVSTRLVRGKHQGERLIHSYLDRWACEEGYRFSKQDFALERIQARSYKILRNLVALALVSWAMLAEEQHQAEATTLLHGRLRRGKPSGPLIQLGLPGLAPRL